MSMVRLTYCAVLTSSLYSLYTWKTGYQAWLSLMYNPIYKCQYICVCVFNWRLINVHVYMEEAIQLHDLPWTIQFNRVKQSSLSKHEPRSMKTNRRRSRAVYIHILAFAGVVMVKTSLCSFNLIPINIAWAEPCAKC